LLCSNPDALGIDELGKGIFCSLKSIAQLPPSPPKEDDQFADSAASTAENLATGEADKKSRSLALVSSFMRCGRVVFSHSFADILVFFR